MCFLIVYFFILYVYMAIYVYTNRNMNMHKYIAADVPLESKSNGIFVSEIMNSRIPRFLDSQILRFPRSQIPTSQILRPRFPESGKKVPAREYRASCVSEVAASSLVVSLSTKSKNPNLAGKYSLKSGFWKSIELWSFGF